MRLSVVLSVISFMSFSSFAVTGEEVDFAELAAVEEVNVWGQAGLRESVDYVSPTSVLTIEDMVSINIATTEDILKHEPNLIVRRRFIGDSNGTLGIRGSNMFQTPRSMVFADGVPLHYFLQSRWNGAPRWTLVSASEIAQVEVIYGPFSAEYSGNAMGGVVLLETAIPERRSLHIDGSVFSQAFADYGFDENLRGYKGFASYGNKVGDLSYYLAFNHLDNESQAQTFREFRKSPEDSAEPITQVSGGISGKDRSGNKRIWYGDTGIVDTTTDNFKAKFGYDFDSWSTLLNIAYEDRSSIVDSPNSYIHDASGKAVWSGAVEQGGQSFIFESGRLPVSELNRESLIIGLRVKGELADDVFFESNLSHFSILKDEKRSSKLNPNDPGYTTEGNIEEYDDSGWDTAEIKLKFENFLTDGMQLVLGAKREAYELNLNVYSSSNYVLGQKDDVSSLFGGETAISAWYAQTYWQINEKWQTAFGLRHENFKSRNGYYDDDDPSTPQRDLEHIPVESRARVSPKFSVAYEPNNDWLIRYSAAKAYRFPIVEELFSQYKAYNTEAFSNPELKPEDGLHHNIMFDRDLDRGYARVNIFLESIDEVIESQTDPTTGVRSFVPIDQVETRGIEFILNKSGWFFDELDVRFSLAYTEAEITKNKANPEIVGNTFPRMPKWRSSLLATYHISDRWNVGGSLLYASDSFGLNTNGDHEENVYGAHDSFARVGMKTTYEISDQIKLGIGVDNLTNEIAYVAHPWPGRTVYLNFSYDL